MIAQNRMILEYLESGACLTALEALDRFGCFRLAARINDLKRKGAVINRHWRKENGKRYAVYTMGAI